MKLVLFFATLFSMNAFAVTKSDLVGTYKLHVRACEGGGKHKYPLTAADDMTYTFADDGVWLLSYQLGGQDGIKRDAGVAGYFTVKGSELAMEDVQVLLAGIGWRAVAGSSEDNTKYYQISVSGSRLLMATETEDCPAGQRELIELRKK